MSMDLRSLMIPRNRKGLPEGEWLRVPELQAWLRENGYEVVAKLIQEQLRLGPTVMRREHQVR